ncbi:hypothetical protein V8B97DRAFT_2021663 [Scleroderma yunnanense]
MLHSNLGENNSLALHLESIEETLGELQESVGQQKQTLSRMNSNHHAVLKSIIQPLFSQFCEKKCTAALAVVKPPRDKQLYELTDEGMQIWHPDWLGKVDDKINVKFIKELAECAFNNEKAQRKQTQLKSIPDKAKDLNSDQGACRIKAVLLYEQESGNQGAAALILTDLGSDILTCNDDKLHKHVFDIGPKHLSCYLPKAKAMVFKAMVDDRWYDKHLDMVGFYSCINTEDLLKADMTYLKKLDDWLKTETPGQ